MMSEVRAKENNGASLSRLLHPSGIAVIGASADASRIGGQPIRALLSAGYAGRIYPVNPKYEEVAGLKCYPSIEQIDGPCDIALIALPAAAVPLAIRGCGEAAIPYAIVLSGGFKETGETGRRLEDALKKAARDAAVRVIGPNCQGMISVPERVYATFGAPAGETALRHGPVSMTFQSGGFGFSVALLCESLGVGFRYCVSTGNEADITTPELLEAFLEDHETKLACAYFEGVSDGRALMQVAARALSVGKPILVWKGGKTDVGVRAAASHTANMTGSYAVHRAAFRQCGIIEVTDAEDLVDLSRVFGYGTRLPAGPRVGVLGISGGAGIVFADTAVQNGLVLPAFAPHTASALSGVVPVFGSTANPADITADIFNDISRFEKAVNLVLSDPNVDQLCLLLASLPGRPALAAANAIVSAARLSDKPVLVGWSALPKRAAEAYGVLNDAAVPIISTPGRLARAAAALARYADDRRRRRAPLAVSPPRSPTELSAGPRVLSEAESKRLLVAYGVGVTRDVVVPPDGDPEAAARCLHYPLAAKVVSGDIPHKTEAGAVRLHLHDAQAVHAAFDEILRNTARSAPRARIEGVMLSEMVSDGIELLIGVTSDPTFGPTVALGLGGTLTEVLQDITYRIAPFDLAVADEMIWELRASRIFEGVRGARRCDVEALARALVAVSHMAWELRDRLQELDINPLFVLPEGGGVVAADALVVLSG